jgi:hypothetical protein
MGVARRDPYAPSPSVNFADGNPSSEREQWLRDRERQRDMTPYERERALASGGGGAGPPRPPPRGGFGMTVSLSTHVRSLLAQVHPLLP